MVDDSAAHAPAEQAGRGFVYLVMTHTAPEQVLRLVRTLRRLSPASAIVVHHDERFVALDRDALAAVGGVTYLNALGPISWGDFTQVDALLRALRHIDGAMDYDWVVQLSGQDYPIRPLHILENRLRSGSGQAYLKHELVGDRRSAARRLSEQYVRRYFFWYFRLPLGAGSSPARTSSAKASRGGTGSAPATGGGPLRIVGSVLRGLRAFPLPVYVRRLPRGLGRRIGLWNPASPFPADFPCHKGSYWAVLSRAAARRLLHETERRRRLVRHYRRTLNPDESFVATVLVNDEQTLVVNDSLRFSSWNAGDAHPKTLGIADLDELQRSGGYFARKFDEGADVEILEELDRRLGVVPGDRRPS